MKREFIEAGQMTRIHRNGLFISDTTILLFVVLWLIFTGNTTSKNRHAAAQSKPIWTPKFAPDETDETLEEKAG